ncbi:O-fucosyltransferase family protein [Paenibacillus sedimenti]|uniref:O-fucosyltransferase family protein n=1 Tax=Paenibacillus sedimenti TaxID=2770274 RepID=A0A926KQE2_9BACL|nr:O-fucosyltransferase family protein [Paenibacillus sedimenti]MBD0381562.1 O-fucosyltransferase family protein [Paenibacillus sedimenti]
MSEKKKYLLIKARRAGFWSDCLHVAGQLLLAELTGRTPIVYWGSESLYASEKPSEQDAFTMYFKPISKYTIAHLERGQHSYYPSIWHSKNLRQHVQRIYYKANEAMNRQEDVLVSNAYAGVKKMIPFIQPNHPAYGLKVSQIYPYILQKYFKLQADTDKKINQFYNIHMRNKQPLLAVHIRASDKIRECKDLYEINSRYPKKLDQLLLENPNHSIFLLTDSVQIQATYKQLYGNRLINTNARRTASDHTGVHTQPDYNKQEKGFDIVRDTFLALRCDTFLGNPRSNVTKAISWLKPWEKNKIHYIKS